MKAQNGSLKQQQTSKGIPRPEDKKKHKWSKIDKLKRIALS